MRALNLWKFLFNMFYEDYEGYDKRVNDLIPFLRRPFLGPNSDSCRYLD